MYTPITRGSLVVVNDPAPFVDTFTFEAATTFSSATTFNGPVNFSGATLAALGTTSTFLDPLNGESLNYDATVYLYTSVSSSATLPVSPGAGFRIVLFKIGTGAESVVLATTSGGASIGGDCIGGVVGQTLSGRSVDNGGYLFLVPNETLNRYVGAIYDGPGSYRVSA